MNQIINHKNLIKNKINTSTMSTDKNATGETSLNPVKEISKTISQIEAEYKDKEMKRLKARRVNYIVKDLPIY